MQTGSNFMGSISESFIFPIIWNMRFSNVVKRGKAWNAFPISIQGMVTAMIGFSPGCRYISTGRGAKEIFEEGEGSAGFGPGKAGSSLDLATPEASFVCATVWAFSAWAGPKNPKRQAKTAKVQQHRFVVIVVSVPTVSGCASRKGTS
jgi:hypothetical protein